MHDDLEKLTRDELAVEVKKLRAGIREHRDSTKHELCWHHPALWGLLPEKAEPALAVPDWQQFLRDRWAFQHHFVSITPLRLDLTHEKDLARVISQPFESAAPRRKRAKGK